MRKHLCAFVNNEQGVGILFCFRNNLELLYLKRNEKGRIFSVVVITERPSLLSHRLSIDKDYLMVAVQQK